MLAFEVIIMENMEIFVLVFVTICGHYKCRDVGVGSSMVTLHIM